jgi:hypothetical protein
MAWCESGAREPFSLFRFCGVRVNKKQPFRGAFDKNSASRRHRATLRYKKSRRGIAAAAADDGDDVARQAR